MYNHNQFADRADASSNSNPTSKITIMDRKIPIVLVDDQSLIRTGLKTLLELESDLTIVAEAENGEQATAIIDSLSAQKRLPSVVLMDIRMPIMDGVAATKLLSQKYPSLGILILTTFDHDAYVTEALKAGAKGYILKDTPAEEVANAIRTVDRGYAQLSPGILEKLMPRVSQPELIPPEFELLTPREKEVLKFLSQGASNREIAQSLFISEGTVKNHVTNILSRLNLRDRTQAALFSKSFNP
jgi:DNA-binding NarL/FixJ family response regulator